MNRFLVVLLLLAFPGLLSAQLQPSSVTATFDFVGFAPTGDTDGDGQVDCGDFADFRGLVVIQYPLPGPPAQAWAPVSGTLTLPSSPVGWSYTEQTFGHANAMLVQYINQPLGCTPGIDCSELDVVFATQQPPTCPLGRCEVSATVRLRRQTACFSGLSASLDMDGGTVFDQSVIPADFNGVNTPACSGLTCAPAGAIIKSASPNPVAPGELLTYTITATNVGTTNSAGGVITETVPANTTFLPASSSPGWFCSPNNNAGSTCSSSLPSPFNAGASVARSFVVQVANPLPPGVTTIGNSACVNIAGASGPSCTSIDTPTGGQPNLTAAKTAAPAPVTPGGVLTYTISFANNGNQAATAVLLTETVPANTTFNAGASSAGWSCLPNNNAGSSCSLSLGTVNAGAAGNRTFAVTVANPLPAGVTSIGNTVCVSSAEPDQVPADNCGSNQTPTGGQPNLTAAKTAAPSPVAPGGVLTYTITFANNGNQAATAVLLTETVPANTTFNAGASSPGWSCLPNNNAGSTCSLSLGTVNAGAAGNRTFAVTVANPLPAGVTSIGNTVCVSSAEPDQVPADNCGSNQTPTSGQPNLTAAKAAAPAPVAPGGVLTYTISFANNGNQAATAVLLTETVPANTTFNAGASSAGWSCLPNNNAGSSCSLSLGTVNAGAAGNRTFAVTVANPLPAGVTSIGNTVCVSSAEPDQVPADNCGSNQTPTSGQPNLTATKTAAPSPVAPGGVLTYIITFTNTGNQGATGVLLTETVPANTTFNAGTSSPGWTCLPNNNAGATCSLSLGTVGGGAGGNRTFAVTVDNPLPAGVTSIGNTICISGDEPDQVPADNCGSNQTPTSGQPNLYSSKTASPSPIAPGALLTYTVAYGNNGDQDAANVVLNETVPDNTTFNASASAPGWLCVPDNTAGSACTLAVGVVTAGAAANLAFAVDVITPAPFGLLELTNQVCITSTPPDALPTDNCGDATTPVDAEPLLQIVKTAPAGPVPAGLLVYTLTFSNVGNRNAAGVDLVETVPSGTSFDSGASSPGWSCNPDDQAGAACSISVGAVAAGSGGVRTFAVTLLSPVQQTTVENTACIEDTGPPPIRRRGPAPSTCSSTSTPTATPNLTVTKTAMPTPVAPGELLTYTLTFTNAGVGDAHDAVLNETVPDHTTFAPGSSSPGWSCAPDNNPGAACTLAIGTVLAGGSSSRTFAVEVTNPLPLGVTTIGNTACVAEDGSDPSPGDDCHSITTPVGQEPNLELDIDDTIDDANNDQVGNPTEAVHYTATLTNIGNQIAEAVVFSAPIAPYSTLIVGSFQTDRGTITLGDTEGDLTVAAVLGDLEPGGSVTLTWSVEITELELQVTHLEVHGQVSANNTLADEPSNDPETPEDDDPTLTPLGIAGGPEPEPVAIPTLDELAFAILTLLLAGAAFLRLRQTR